MARTAKDPLTEIRRSLGVRVDIEPDWAEVAGVVEEADRRVAPKKLLAELDGR